MNFLSIIKRIFSLLLCLIFIVGFAASATTAAGVGDGGEDVSPYTIIHDEALSIPIGTGNGQVGYDFGEVPLQIRGPGSFYVDESGWMAILDSENSRILLYVNGQCTNMLSLPSGYYATKMCFANNIFYVLDVPSSKVCEVPFIMTLDDPDKEAYVKHDLPEGLAGLTVVDMLITPNGLAVVDMDENYYYLTQDNGFVLGATYSTYEKTACGNCEEEGHEHETPIEPTVNIGLGTLEWNIALDKNINDLAAIDKDAASNLYAEYFDYVTDVYTIMSERTVRKYDANGNIVGYARIDDDGLHTYAGMLYEGMAAGTVYYMACNEEMVSIQRLVFGTTYASRMNELTQRALRMDAELEAMEQADEDNPEKKSKIYALSRTRAQVKSRADSMVKKRWLLQSYHKDLSQAGSDRYNIKLPIEVSKASPGQYLTGIPYCRGGFNGLDNLGSGRLRDFDTAIKARPGIAGNANGGNWISPTVGLDCSGFVSSAYGLREYHNTGDLNLYIGHKAGTNDLNSASNMDLYVRVTGEKHTVLFVRKSGGKYIIIDSTTYSNSGGNEGKRIDKVSERDVGISFFNGYVRKTAWHQVIAKYGHNSTSHWKPCKYYSQCGYKTSVGSHVWINVGSSIKKCQTCGRLAARSSANGSGLINSVS